MVAMLSAALVACGGDAFRGSEVTPADSGGDVADEVMDAVPEVDAQGDAGGAVDRNAADSGADGYDGACTPIAPSPAYACATGSCFGNLSCFYGNFGAQCAVLPPGCACAETLSCACLTGANDPCRAVGERALTCTMDHGHAIVECTAEATDG